MIRRLKKLIKKSESERFNKLYNTLIGSIVTTIGIFKGMTEEQNWKMFRELEKMGKKGLLDKYNTTLLLFNFIDFQHGKVLLSDDVRKHIVLVYDQNGIRGPLVSFVDSPATGNIMPIAPTGEFTGILRMIAEGRENIIIEYMFPQEEEDVQD